MSVSLLTKGMICQGHITVNVTQRFVLPLKVSINNKVFNLNINRTKQEININQPLNLDCKLHIDKKNLNIHQKTLKLNVKRICS